MGWLEEIERVGKFKCSGCKCKFTRTLDPTLSIRQHEDTLECPQCNTAGSVVYNGFTNAHRIGLTKHVQRSTYEKNGRKAVRIGNTYMSKSKYNYLETGKINEYYTKEYDEHTVKQESKVKHQANQIVKGLQK